ncbi:hypothetical protein FLI74_25535 [Pseudomonas aeruginosa]|uniref:hypothetical protein n=1 Tax=Pseudomonas TaxID=286 RepID=UPI0010A3B284|nr:MULTISPECIES: hypothetical protein [Pseudomonas]EKW7196818.1 hypothetical protein [Pseudomonas aeruginosa]ELM3798891.1 hypothetical protein [Pseudomonas aeruginosa]MBG4342038.1 hypothetical protein [Pseudomonas aeruginosa]MBV5561074.1 hypothetical protein [Pseudomonas aeruginosa]MDX2310060.1 hypothetical protein [Pseudomonas sp. On1]
MDNNRGGHSHVKKRANNPHNLAGKRQIRVHNYANEVVPFIVHGKKAFREKHVKKDFVANGGVSKDHTRTLSRQAKRSSVPKCSLERPSALLRAHQIGRW